MKTLSLASVFVLFASATAQDQPLPPQFRGNSSGYWRTSFGSVDPNNPDALECVDELEVSRSLSVSDDGYTLRLSGTDSVTERYGATTVTVPRQPTLTYTATRYENDIAYLRSTEDNVIRAYLLRREGGSLIMSVLGGAGIGFAQQSDPAAYAAVRDEADVTDSDESVCVKAPGSNAPLRSINVFVGDSRELGSASGASATMLTVGAAAIAIASSFAL